MEVRWSPEAADDLEGIVLYIQRDSPEVARKVAAIIIDAVGGLSMFPKRGRTGRIEGTRELVVSTLDCCVSRSRWSCRGRSGLSWRAELALSAYQSL